MSIPILSDTRVALGDDAAGCASRSLFKDRFADPDPQAKEDDRKRWFTHLLKRSPETVARSQWLPGNAGALHARLMSRLLVDLAGGVMENANVLLDRYGLPFIPGSAVKGCARRMALQALHDWIASGTPRPAEDDACAPCCEGFGSPAAMLAAIARIFGWVEKDWDAGRKEGLFRSDFGWACGDDHESIWTETSKHLAQGFGWRLPEERPWKQLPNFAGSIAFVHATPNADPGLELDVVTPHHTDYYQGKLETATDTEDPVPVNFPAIRAQRDTDYFTFPLIPLRRADNGDLTIARLWLARGLELFGLGAKTAAGYGWFDASDVLQAEIQARRETALQAAKAAADRKAEEERNAREATLLRQKREEEAKALEGLSAEEQEDWKIARLTEPQFEAKLKSFFKEPRNGGPSEAEKPAIVRALKGPRIGLWNQFKAKATKGELATSADAIRALNKKLHGDKMP